MSIVVSLSSDKAEVVVPPSVTIPDGAKTASFAITTKEVTSPVTATITAEYPPGTKKTAPVVVNPVPKLLDVIAPSPIAGGNSATGTVDIDWPA